MESRRLGRGKAFLSIARLLLYYNKTDEENVLTGFHIVSHKAICSIDVSGCKGLTHLLCPNQMLKQMSLSKTEYLSVLDVHGNRLQRINLRKNPLLTIVDCSNNPLQR